VKAVELGSLLERIAGGGTPSKAVFSYFDGDIPFATVKDFKCRRPIDTTDHITTDALANSASELVPADTLLLTTRMTIGKAARFPVPVAINQDIKAIFPKACLDKDYLEWFLFSKTEELAGKGSGTTVKGVRLADIRGLQIVLPLIEEQRRIAAKLDGLFTRSQGHEMSLVVYLDW
jgi:type I restriction enzyme S subunit